MKRAWAVLLATVLGACSGDVERPGPTGPAGPKLDTRVVRVLSPRPGEVLSVDAVVREPGLVVVADVSRLAEGGAVRFSVATDLGSTPFFERDVIREPGRLTANTRVPVDVSVLEHASSLRIVATALGPGGETLGKDAATVVLR